MQAALRVERHARGGSEMNQNSMGLSASGFEALGVGEASPPQVFPVLYQLRALSFVSVGATFRPEVVAGLLPPGLTAADGCTGGFLVALAREGYLLAPFSFGHVWFDVIGHDGSAGPGRYLPRQGGVAHALRSSKAAGAPASRASITESPDRLVAQLDRADSPAMRLTVSSSSNWTSCAGIDHAITGGDAAWPVTRLTVTPWAAEWSDADPIAVEVFAPEWADLRPVDLTWAAVGRQGAITLGLSAPLPA